MFHYKDNRPVNTINQIRQILSETELLPTEQWLHQIENVYSVRLTLPGISADIGTNGKGKTKELALASAYGELMERLQNQILYPLFFYYDFDASLKEYRGFAYDPNERVLDSTEVLSELPDEVLSSLSIDRDADIYEESFTDNSKQNGGLATVQYYNLDAGSFFYFPILFVSYFYGSNGMAAGNTPEEALVQGVSEIIERFVMRELLSSTITPPDIERDKLERYFPEEYETIKGIEAINGNEIIVKDCSLDAGFPVIGVILLNKKVNSYYIKFGSHPDLHIALERALTELLQGRDIGNRRDLVKFNIFLNDSFIQGEGNFHSIFRNGVGHYPIDVFKRTFTYASDKRAYARNFTNNCTCLQYLFKIVRRMNWHLLVRDVSFLGFPAYSTIIPGISELNRSSDKKLKPLYDYLAVGRMLRRLSELSDEEIRRIVNFMEIRKSDGYSNNLKDLTNLPLSNNSILSKIDTNIFLAIAYRKMEELEKAYTSLNNYLTENETGSESLRSYYECAKSFLALMSKTPQRDDHDDILTRLYENEIVKKVKRDFREPDSLLFEIGSLGCPQCSECKYLSGCSYDEIRKIHIRLKDRLQQRPVDQQRLAGMLNSYV